MKPVAIIKVIDKDSGTVMRNEFESELELDNFFETTQYKVWRCNSFRMATTIEYERELDKWKEAKDEQAGSDKDTGN